MRRRTSNEDRAAFEPPFLVRHLPLILTLLLIAALHQPLAKGLAPQIEYVSALMSQDAPHLHYQPAGREAVTRDTIRQVSHPGLISI